MKRKYPPKPLFIERMKLLLGKDFKEYEEILKKEPVKSIRVNTLKISPEELKKKLEIKGWKITQPWKDYPEVMIIESTLLPGELGRALEHLLGYYYVQELASMLPIIALKPKENEKILDLCAAPGSKTTQIASEMKNTGLIIANEIHLGRIKILASNLERCGVTNTIITRKEGRILCERLKQKDFKCDKILLDAPCSGEGTLRSTPVTYLMWNPKTIRRLASLQKKLFESAFELLKINGEIIYSTCTHAPEENEAIINHVIEKFGNQIKIEKITLPINCRPGISSWKDKKYCKETKQACRIYPQDNNTEGFFITKFRRVK
ncbi:RsmB/NOP family class I SAM-dependent RNA methyltransferase [Candidatus Pacearchaeota archaeon]|nr:RsmB/NOP family class I SAM-dependent RNA methyltransferase [Candidatus Pacearchaeota archaeon]